MKFKAQPKLFVKISNKYLQRVTGKKGFYFDENGEYETENTHLIGVLTQRFEKVEEVIEEVEEVEIEQVEEVKEIVIESPKLKKGVNK